MKKIIKVSLATATAIASMSTANAKDLSEAIKNVDVSGSIVYRYDDYSSDDANGSDVTRNKYKAVLNLKSKVNDDVNANVSFNAGKNTDMYSSDTSNSGDENLDVEMSKLNFDYTGIKNTVVKLGKQGLATPFTMAVDSDAAVQTGTGLMASTTWSGLTFVGGYFNQTNFQDSADKASKRHGQGDKAQYYGGEEDVIIAGLLSNLGPVSIDAWYMALEDNNINGAGHTDSSGTTTGDNTFDTTFDAYTVGANYTFDISNIKMNLDARYSALDFDSEETNAAFGGREGETKNELWKIKAAAKMGIFGMSALYGQTGEDGGYVAVDSSSKATWSAWNVDVNGIADATFIALNANVDILANVNFAVNYNDVDSDFNDDDDHEEVYGQVTHKMSNNFKTYLRYGQYTQSENGEDNDSDVGRIQVEYTF